MMKKGIGKREYPLKQGFRTSPPRQGHGNMAKSPSPIARRLAQGHGRQVGDRRAIEIVDWAMEFGQVDDRKFLQKVCSCAKIIECNDHMLNVIFT